jgi:hypothetical protein
MYSLRVRRSVWLRLVTCLWAFWFGVVLVEPAALSCPMHSSHAGHRMQMPADTADHAQHGTPSHHAHTVCTCLGACCGAPTVAINFGVLPELPVAWVLADGRAPWSHTETRAPSAPRYSHPFANGPPASIA